jgi:hypothetical protein
MKTFVKIAAAVLFATCVRAEMRTWTSLPGKTVEAEYVRIQFDDVILKSSDGKEIQVPLTSFSGEDKEYIELENPPNLSVDIMRSSKQTFVDVSATYPKDPLIILTYQFGARVKQKDSKSYDYPLTVEVYAFTQQRYDPSKYHLIQRTKSAPFVLSQKNGRRFEYTAKQKNEIIAYELFVEYLNWRESRGEKFAETLILVRDKRDKIIAYNTTKNWLYNNLDKLEELPVGAWLNDDCIRTHPTQPKSFKDLSGAGFL